MFNCTVEINLIWLLVEIKEQQQGSFFACAARNSHHLRHSQFSESERLFEVWSNSTKWVKLTQIIKSELREISHGQVLSIFFKMQIAQTFYVHLKDLWTVWTRHTWWKVSLTSRLLPKLRTGRWSSIYITSFCLVSFCYLSFFSFLAVIVKPTDPPERRRQ